MRKFAAFDIDGTIFRWQLYHELFDAFIREGILLSDQAEEVLMVREQWQTRQTSYDEYEMTLVHLMVKVVVGLDAERFGDIADDILRSKGHRNYRYTLELLQRLKSEGYVIIAISGSYQQLVDRFAALHDIDIAVGKKHQIVDGKLTANATEIFGNKSNILKQLIAEHSLSYEHSYAVGDSGSDIGMLEIVEHPVAFNPDEKLKSTAMERGWDIVVERKSIAYVLKKGPDGSYLLAETTTG